MHVLNKAKIALLKNVYQLDDLSDPKSLRLAEMEILNSIDFNYGLKYGAGVQYYLPIYSLKNCYAVVKDNIVLDVKVNECRYRKNSISIFACKIKEN